MSRQETMMINTPAHEASVATAQEQTKRLDLEQDPASKKRGSHLPVESSENTTFDFHVAIFCLMIGVIFGFILSMKLSVGGTMATSRPVSRMALYRKPFAEIPTDSTVVSSSVVPEVTTTLFCPDDDMAEWSSSEPALCPQNETSILETPAQEESSSAAAATIDGTHYSLTILQEMEGYSIDGLIYSLYHTMLGSL